MLILDQEHLLIYSLKGITTIHGWKYDEKSESLLLTDKLMSDVNIYFNEKGLSIENQRDTNYSIANVKPKQYPNNTFFFINKNNCDLFDRLAIHYYFKKHQCSINDFIEHLYSRPDVLVKFNFVVFKISDLMKLYLEKSLNCKVDVEEC